MSGWCRCILELHGALNNALALVFRGHQPRVSELIEAHLTTTAWRWVKTAVKRAEELGAIRRSKAQVCCGEAREGSLRSAPTRRAPGNS